VKTSGMENQTVQCILENVTCGAMSVQDRMQRIVWLVNCMPRDLHVNVRLVGVTGTARPGEVPARVPALGVTGLLRPIATTAWNSHILTIPKLACVTIGGWMHQGSAQDSTRHSAILDVLNLLPMTVPALPHKNASIVSPMPIAIDMASACVTLIGMVQRTAQYILGRVTPSAMDVAGRIITSVVHVRAIVLVLHSASVRQNGLGLIVQYGLEPVNLRV
jgi:hypothetical protein